MIVAVEPKDFATAPAVVVLTDTTEVIPAIKEVDTWAHAHGFLRSREPFLTPVLRGERRLLQGLCYRQTEGHKAAARRTSEEYEGRLREMPEGPPSDVIMRELRA